MTEETDFRTSQRKLTIKPHVSEKVQAKITSDTIFINYPQNLSVKEDLIQEFIKDVIIQVLRSEAKEYLPKQTQKLAQKFGFSYNTVYIKNHKTLWGSCSSKNNINLNLHLMRLPKYLIDYVIIHELCHTKEKNHGTEFWKLVDKIVGNGKKLSKELRAFSYIFLISVFPINCTLNLFF